MAIIPASLTVVPPNFGRGGAGLTPNRGSGSPSLEDLLTELQAAANASTKVFVTTIDFSALGSGATDSILITGFPTNVTFRGIAASASPQFTGEPDLVFEVGFEGGNVDALMASEALHETGVGTPIALTSGVQKGGDFLPDAVGAGLAVLFTATELDDVTAGLLTLRILFEDPFL